MSYYAVRTGRIPGIYRSWDECKLQVDKYSGAIYKKFSSKNAAKEFILGEKNSDRDLPICNRELSDGKRQTTTTNSLKLIIDNQDTTYSNIYTNTITAFIDGACSNNQNSALAKASCGVVFPYHPNYNKARLLKGVQTNIRAEFSAFILACEQIDAIEKSHPVFQKNGSVVIMYSDSETLVKTINEYLPVWKTNNYKNDTVKNRDLVDLIDAQYQSRNISIYHVRGHQKGDDFYAKHNRAVDELCGDALSRRLLAEVP